ncbi:hypothetical protein DIPPA_34988 [Diplonema papillatum]|nr:hypothetical protein DIPPA_34988 [Diplonema papillatum]|eukprot:gene18508-28568_t
MGNCCTAAEQSPQRTPKRKPGQARRQNAGPRAAGRQPQQQQQRFVCVNGTAPVLLVPGEAEVLAAVRHGDVLCGTGETREHEGQTFHEVSVGNAHGWITVSNRATNQPRFIPAAVYTPADYPRPQMLEVESLDNRSEQSQQADDDQQQRYGGRLLGESVLAALADDAKPTAPGQSVVLENGLSESVVPEYQRRRSRNLGEGTIRMLERQQGAPTAPAMEASTPAGQPFSPARPAANWRHASARELHQRQVQRNETGGSPPQPDLASPSLVVQGRVTNEPFSSSHHNNHDGQQRAALPGPSTEPFASGEEDSREREPAFESHPTVPVLRPPRQRAAREHPPALFLPDVMDTSVAGSPYVSRDEPTCFGSKTMQAMVAANGVPNAPPRPQHGPASSCVSTRSAPFGRETMSVLRNNGASPAAPPMPGSAAAPAHEEAALGNSAWTVATTEGVAGVSLLTPTGPPAADSGRRQPPDGVDRLHPNLSPSGNPPRSFTDATYTPTVPASATQNQGLGSYDEASRQHEPPLSTRLPGADGHSPLDALYFRRDSQNSNESGDPDRLSGLLSAQTTANNMFQSSHVSSPLGHSTLPATPWLPPPFTTSRHQQQAPDAVSAFEASAHNPRAP